MKLQLLPHMSIATIGTDEFSAKRVNGALDLVPGIKSYNVLLHVAATLLDQMDEKLERVSDVWFELISTRYFLYLDESARILVGQRSPFTRFGGWKNHSEVTPANWQLSRFWEEDWICGGDLSYRQIY